MVGCDGARRHVPFLFWLDRRGGGEGSPSQSSRYRSDRVRSVGGRLGARDSRRATRLRCFLFSLLPCWEGSVSLTAQLRRLLFSLLPGWEGGSV